MKKGCAPGAGRLSVRDPRDGFGGAVPEEELVQEHMEV